MEKTLARLANLDPDQLYIESGRTALEVEGVLGAVPPSLDELRLIGQEWWKSIKGDVCREVNKREEVRKAIHGGAGVDPTAQAVALVALLQPQLPNLHAVQVCLVSFLLLRHTVKDLCAE